MVTPWQTWWKLIARSIGSFKPSSRHHRWRIVSCLARSKISILKYIQSKRSTNARWKIGSYGQMSWGKNSTKREIKSTKLMSRNAFTVTNGCARSIASTRSWPTSGPDNERPSSWARYSPKSTNRWRITAKITSLSSSDLLQILPKLVVPIHQPRRKLVEARLVSRLIVESGDGHIRNRPNQWDCQIRIAYLDHATCPCHRLRRMLMNRRASMIWSEALMPLMTRNTCEQSHSVQTGLRSSSPMQR